MGVCGIFIAFFNIFMCAVSFVIYAGDRYDQIFIEGLESSEYNTLYMIKNCGGKGLLFCPWENWSFKLYFFVTQADET